MLFERLRTFGRLNPSKSTIKPLVAGLVYIWVIMRGVLLKIPMADRFASYDPLYGVTGLSFGLAAEEIDLPQPPLSHVIDLFRDPLATPIRSYFKQYQG